MNILKDYSKILIIFLFTYFLILNLFQLSQQHWSSMLDQDIMMMYNSLLISSGIEQEYRDHPAYTTFFLLGSIFKICSIFFDNFTVQEILNSKNIDENLQTLFIIGRIVNGFYVFLVAFIIFNILKEFNVNKYICIFSTLTIILFQDTYELLFLIRSEILSLLMILLFLYFLIKFIKTNEIKYTLLSGFFLCFSMLAKIQVIFLFFTFLISLPFLINHFKFQKQKNNLIYGKNYYILCFSLLVLFLSSYVLFQILLGVAMINEANDPRFYFTYNIDLFLFLIFIIFYSLFIKFLSVKKIISSSKIIITISSVLSGFIFCMIFIFFLDLINLIPFNKLNIMRLTNPIEYMTSFTLLDAGRIIDANIFDSLIRYLHGSGGLADLRFNKSYDQTMFFYLDARTFFRTLHLLFIIFLIYYSSKIVKNNNLNFLSISLFFGIFVLFLSFNLRETHGYNIYLFPLYVIVASIIFDKLKKKSVVIFYLFLSIVFFSENLIISSIHKNVFVREPRVYDICGIEKWKNSINYIDNYNKSSYITLVNFPKNWFKIYTKRFDDAFFKKYCNQLLNEAGNRPHLYKLNK